MSRHVRPEKWADAFAGRLTDDEVGALDAHAARCATCRTARDRVQRASSSFPALRKESAPDLAWDSVRARVHWAVSKERRTGATPKYPAARAWLGPAIAGAVAVSGIALAVTTEPDGSSVFGDSAVAGAPSPIASHAPVPAPAAPVPAAPLAGIVSRMSGQVMVDGVRRTDVFDYTLGPGTVLATADGRIDVQFGDGSAFALGAGSTLELRKFDVEQIELVVQGTVDIEVAPRAAGQRFVVRAGERLVEVRGTQFRVTHDTAGMHVACRHGRVAVRDSRGELEVATARKLDLAGDAVLDPVRVAPLSAAELDTLAEATPMTMPIWTDAASLVKTSSALEVATTAKRAVRVDGVEVGEGPLRVRVMPGRHTVETGDSAGRFRRAGWVDVAAAKPARLAVQPEAAATGGTAARRRQLHTGIDRARLANCTRAITKAGLTSFVQIEISIDETGAVGFLNVIDTDLSSTTAGCVRDVLADVHFRPGPSATFRDKLDL